MKNLKSGFLLLVFFMLLSFQGYTQNKRADKVIKDSEQRAYTMKVISNDSLMLAEMTSYLLANEKAMKQLSANKAFTKKLMSSKMMKKMDKDAEKEKEGMKMCPMCEKKKKEKEEKKKNENNENK